MKLVYKTIVSNSDVNANNSASGGYLFGLLDYGAVTLISEQFVNRMPNKYQAVTASADIKYINSVFPFDFIEVYANITNITSAYVEVFVELNSRNKKSMCWERTVTANFKFSIIDINTRKIVRIPKEVINEIKG